jgi:hypothetical protein
MLKQCLDELLLVLWVVQPLPDAAIALKAAIASIEGQCPSSLKTRSPRSSVDAPEASRLSESSIDAQRYIDFMVL